MKKMIRIPFITILLLTFILGFHAAEAQKNTWVQQENKLVKLYADLFSKIDQTYDTVEKYSTKFDKEFIRCIKNNPASMTYPFKKLIDKGYCNIYTSADGNFRYYSWDTWTGGTGHVFKEVIQWKSNNKVYSKEVEGGEGDGGCFISKLYTVMIQNKPHYLVIRNGIYSSKQAGQSIYAYCIQNNQLNDTVKVFKTKTKMLNFIDVNFDFFSVVDHPERPLQLISFDEKKKILYIPVVDQNDQVTKKNILYELKNTGFEYIGIETGKRK